MALQTGSQQSRSYRGNVTQINTLQRFSVKGKVHPKTVKSHIILKNNWFFSSSSLFSNQFVILELPETWITPDELRLFTFTWTFPLRAERVWGLASASCASSEGGKTDLSGRPQVVRVYYHVGRTKRRMCWTSQQYCRERAGKRGAVDRWGVKTGEEKVRMWEVSAGGRRFTLTRVVWRLRQHTKMSMKIFGMRET